jgi:hypothetical protein
MENTIKNRQLITDVLSLAKSHLGEGEMASSAELCYETAHDIMCRTLHDDHADITGAYYHVLRSLAYSVGLSHPDYKIAERIFARELMEGYNLLHGWITGEYDPGLCTIQQDDWCYRVIESSVHRPGTERPTIAL